MLIQMNSSSNGDRNNEQRQKSEHFYPSDPSNMDNQHQNIAALPHHYSLPRYVDHTYRDFSTYIKDGNRIEKHKKCDRNFPALVHSILSNDQYSHIISWMPHGRAWKILDKELLMEEIAPKFFGQSKYASFARQLSGWGFKRLHQTGPDFGCYYHECFLRGHSKLTILMRRVSVGRGKGTPDMNAEPDFYKIAKHFPLVESADRAGTDDERVVKNSSATFSESENIQKTDFLDGADIDIGLDGGPELSRHTSAPTSISVHHQWDPYQPVGAAAHYYPPFPHPQHPLERATTGAGLKEHYDHSTHQYHSKRHLFASYASDDSKDRNDDKDKDTVKGSPEKYHQHQPRPIPLREPGYLDHFPASISPLYSNAYTSSSNAMHTCKNQAQQPHTPYHRPGPNINQYAQSHSPSSQRSSFAAVPMSTMAMVAPPPYHHYSTPTPPRYHHYAQSSQYQDSHTRAYDSIMPDPNHDYTHRYPHHNNDHQHYNSQGHGSDRYHVQVQGSLLPPPVRGPNPNLGSTPQITLQAQANDPSASDAGAADEGARVHDQNHDLHGPHPSFSPLRSSREEHSSEKD